MKSSVTDGCVKVLLKKLTSTSLLVCHGGTTVRSLHSGRKTHRGKTQCNNIRPLCYQRQCRLVQAYINSPLLLDKLLESVVSSHSYRGSMSSELAVARFRDLLRANKGMSSGQDFLKHASSWNLNPRFSKSKCTALDLGPYTSGRC